MSVLADHPNAGGEISCCLIVVRVIFGPSPRGWGNLRKLSGTDAPQRAIPTRVGKSFVSFEQICAAPGHPHAGGEIRSLPKRLESKNGPSPRGWGNQADIALAWANERAIPTRVGKSSIAKRRPTRPAGHPHAGGEIATPSKPYHTTPGPSPRGWGNRCRGVCLGFFWRAIPTRVGKSTPRPKFHRVRAGHPHAGGEILMCGKRICIFRGPSPRGWGNQ